jgi:hypothetical protein
MTNAIKEFLKTTKLPLEENFPFAYYEPIKNKIYLTAQFQGDAANQLMFAHNGKEYADKWYFTDKWEGSALFYFLGRV